jgi:hypothetical protein
VEEVLERLAFRAAVLVVADHREHRNRRRGQRADVAIERRPSLPESLGGAEHREVAAVDDAHWPLAGDGIEHARAGIARLSSRKNSSNRADASRRAR